MCGQDCLIFQIISRERGYNMANTKENDEIKQIREDLLNQLIEQNKFGKHFESLVEDYINFEKLKRKMQADINKNGLRIEVMTGNGFVTEKKNDNVLDILKVNGQQLKILQDLDLKAPSQTPKEGGGDDLL